MKHAWAHWLLGAIIAGLAVWFYMNFERVTAREEVGYTGAAARDPMLAFRRLVERMGLEAGAPRERMDFSTLPQGAALVLPRGRGVYGPLQAEKLRSWVASGGHLIVQAEPPHMRDTLLERLRIGRAEVPEKEVTERRPSKPYSMVTLPGGERPLKVWFGYLFQLTDREPARTRFALTGEGGGTTVLHLAEGRGYVTVLPQLWFLNNHQIGEHDHATFAWELIELVPRTKTVLIAPQFDVPSLFTWLAGNARAALVALAAMLAAWGWRAAVRFGPVAPDPTRERRRLLDHLRASGRFLWRSGGQAKLIAAARENAMHKIARTRPALADLQPGDRADRLAELTGLPRRDILHALAAEPETPAAFTSAVGTLQRLEEQLTRKSTGSR